MFKKILVANRGEIACRVMKTARRLGVRTVAVYSDADRDALHVKLADEAVHVGAAPSSESYLRADRIIKAAQQTGAEAIHPGYGFLSENAAFAEACANNDVVFIGPPAAAITAMGSKSAAKQIMEKAGVPLVPGYHGDKPDAETLRKAAEDMGYPVLLKAVAGGGGKGMRQVWKAAEFDEALATAQRESQSSFGNSDMLVEKYLVKPRHVEVQVFCDSDGNGVYLFERDCSVQRRHQKVIEEAPAPGMTAKLRKQMGETALQAASAINYVGAGTVEFLLDEDGAFYFMEMNTRLQVEHPVTEFITGQDLVEWQLRVASGSSLPVKQSELEINGHAFEARIYAEDPDNEFLPQTGELKLLQPPDESARVRVDTGVIEGDTVSVYYDPMIAKLVVWGEDRDQALSQLADALGDYRIAGVTTNVSFLRNLVTTPAFRNADLDTGFIEAHHDEVFRDASLDPDDVLRTIGLYLTLREIELAGITTDPLSPWSTLPGWRMNMPATWHHTITCLKGTEDISLKGTQHFSEEFEADVNGRKERISGKLYGSTLELNISNRHFEAVVHCDGPQGIVFMDGERVNFSVLQPDLGLVDNTGHGGFTAPMNGTVIEVAVKPGETVVAGQKLVIMEAMKMEHAIKAPADGVVVELFCSEGQLIDGGAELLTFEAESEA